MSKDFSLLRSLRLEEIKVGESVCSYKGVPYTVAAIHPKGVVCLSDTYGLFTRAVSELKECPLTWVEDRPVYIGDILWHQYEKEHPTQIVISGVARFDTPSLTANGHGDVGWHISALSWDKPVSRKEIRLLAWLTAQGQLIFVDEKERWPASYSAKRLPHRDCFETVEG